MKRLRPASGKLASLVAKLRCGAALELEIIYLDLVLFAIPCHKMWDGIMSFSATKWVWKQDLPHVEKIVLLCLADRADENLKCWPSMETIAKDCGMCRRSVVRIIEKLREKNLIFTTGGMTFHGKSVYTYNFDLAMKPRKTPCDFQSHPVVTHSHI